MDCECGWSFIVFLYVLIALALYGLFHWIEVILGKLIKIKMHKTRKYN